MLKRIFVEKRQGFFDIPAQNMAEDLRETFRLTDLKAVRLFNRYDIEGLSEEEFRRVKNVVFAEPPVDVVYEERLPDFGSARVFAIEYLPGQFDGRAASAEECVQLVTGRERPAVRLARVVVLVGEIDDKTLSGIKSYLINCVDSREAALDKPKTLSQEFAPPVPVEKLRYFNRLTPEELTNFLSEYGLAMSAEDLAMCQRYFIWEERRAPTITELKVIDTYWSDHCRHTTFNTAIDVAEIEPGEFQPIFKAAYDRYLADRAEVYGGKPKDVTLMDIAVMGMKILKKQGKLPNLDESEEINACSIKVPVKIGEETQEWLVMFKNETHNHPTEIEPFGGAATCLGGAIRDPLSGRAYVYQAMRLTGSADPRLPVEKTLPGKLPQKKITRQAALGYSSYGNQIGLATGQVREVYHEGYMAKRLEIGAVIGAAPKENVKRSRPTPGDVIILVGGRTGRDGLGGATGSSREHTTASLSTCGAEVQKGNPVTERKIERLFRKPEVSRLIKRCNDFGAGGVAVAIGELAPGLIIDLDAIPKKYAGLNGTELAISESQERMAVVIDPTDQAKFLEYAAAENLEATPVAAVANEPRLIMQYGGEVIVSLSRAFLDTNGAARHTSATIAMPDATRRYLRQVPSAAAKFLPDLEKAWLNNLSDLNVCSQKGLSEQFDSTVGANTVLMPFGGKKQMTPAEGMAAKIPMPNGETNTATLMTFGLNPELLSWSPFHGALYSIVEAVTKIVAMGGKADGVHLSLQEYFERLGDDPQKWGKPFAALLGALWAQHELGIAAIGGKDSMSGTFENLHVPPTVAAFAVAVTEAGRVLSPEFKMIGRKVLLVRCPKDEYDLPDFKRLNKNFEKVSKLAEENRVFAAMSVGIGGVAAAITKMCLGNGIGFKFTASLSPAELFAPDYGSIILEVSPKLNVAEALFGVPYVELGETTENSGIICGKAAINLAEAMSNYTKPLEKIFPTQTKEIGRERIDSAPYTHGNKLAPRALGRRPRVLIPVFPGTNCEYESARRWEEAGAETDVLVIRNLTPADIQATVTALTESIRHAKIIMFPGGFSGGDEPDGSGKFIAAMFRNPRLEEEVMRLINSRDGLILGICNGFQALIKLGLLPYGEIRDLKLDSPTLTINQIGRHVSCMVRTKVVSNLSPWFNNVSVGDIHTIAVSHGEGRFTADKEIVSRLRLRGQIATQYVDDNGNATMQMPFNPNGSIAAVEGITSPNGRVLGKMGHSERIGENIGKNVPGNKDQELFAAGVRYFM